MGLDTHPAGPLAEAIAAPSGAAMAEGQRASAPTGAQPAGPMGPGWAPEHLVGCLATSG
jgi:hypothetical protein